jgi:hypothetical protein
MASIAKLKGWVGVGLVIVIPREGGYPVLRGLSTSLRAERSNPWCSSGIDGLLREACHRARVRATRWLAMTVGYSFAISRRTLPLRDRCRCPRHFHLQWLKNSLLGTKRSAATMVPTGTGTTLQNMKPARNLLR